jgi:hypothetical protein
MTSGTILERVNAGAVVYDLVIEGDFLFVLLPGKLRAYSFQDGLTLAGESAVSNLLVEGITHRSRLFVGGGYAYATSYPGYDVIDVRDPAAMKRVGIAKDGGPNSFKQIVLNGSGLGLAAVGIIPRDDGTHEVVDGFHRNRVGKESEKVVNRLGGYLPVTVTNQDRQDRGDRIAATIRHNRARGKHKVEAMSDIVIELKRRNWTDEKIGRELGMDPDEVLRLCQITGIAEVFADQEFSKSWDIDDLVDAPLEVLSDLDKLAADKETKRIFHTWEKWECYQAGFYDERPPEGMTQDQGEELYREVLSDSDRFGAALNQVITTWKHSCEHYLTNDRMNRIAWLGQASMAMAHRIPSCCRGGYHRLTDSQKETADSLALQYLNLWLVSRSEPEVTMEQALGRTEAELY